MPQAQVFGGHGNGGEDDEFGGGQTHLQESVDDTDDLLDEIDSMLDTNAEEFVMSFIQKGGE